MILIAKSLKVQSIKGDTDAPDTKHGSSYTSVSAEVVMLLHAAKM